MNTENQTHQAARHQTRTEQAGCVNRCIHGIKRAVILTTYFWQVSC